MSQISRKMDFFLILYYYYFFGKKKINETDLTFVEC